MSRKVSFTGIMVIFQKNLFMMTYLSLMSITFDIMGVLNEIVRHKLLFPFLFWVSDS